MAGLTFEIRRAAGAQPHYWRIVSDGEVLARSEPMYNRSDALAAARKMKYQTTEYEFEVIGVNDREFPFSWHAQAKNSRLVVSSTDFYRTYTDADDAKELVSINAPYSEIVDLT